MLVLASVLVLVWVLILVLVLLLVLAFVLASVLALVLALLASASIWHYLGPSGGIREHLAASGSTCIWQHLAASGLTASGITCGIWDALAALRSTWPQLKASRSIWHQLAASGNIWQHLAPYHLEPSGTIWQHLAPSELPSRTIRALETRNQEKAFIFIRLLTKVCFWCQKSKMCKKIVTIAERC